MSALVAFAGLPDPRRGNAQRHNQLDMLAIALTASICGAESCVDFADFGVSLRRGPPTAAARFEGVCLPS